MSSTDSKQKKQKPAPPEEWRVLGTAVFERHTSNLRLYRINGKEVDYRSLFREVARVLAVLKAAVTK